MPSFIESCNCKGRTPSGVVSGRHNLRPDIIGQMLKDRNVARFIIAPTGFGKSSIAYEYSQLIFAFENVFWIRGDSPCFLRDLDSRNLAELVFGANPNARLVVCEDVPHIDSARSNLFTSFIDSMLERGCEVVVTCVPTSDTFTSKELDSIILRSSDLLLSDDELEIERSRGNARLSFRDGLPDSERVPCLVWSDSGEDELINGVSDDDLTSSARSMMFAMLVLESGSLKDMTRFVPQARTLEIAEYLSRDYPYLGIDLQSETFESISLDVSKVAGIRTSSKSDARSKKQHGRNCDIRFALADILLSCGKHSRACKLIMESYPRKICAEWLADAGLSILISGGALSFAKSFLSSAKHATGRRGTLSMLFAWSACLLGDEDEAKRRCSSVLRSQSSSLQDNVSAHVLLWWIGVSKCASAKAACDAEGLEGLGHLLSARKVLSATSAASAASEINAILDVGFLSLALSVLEALDAHLRASFKASLDPDGRTCHAVSEGQASEAGSAQDMVDALEALRGCVSAGSKNVRVRRGILVLLASCCVHLTRSSFRDELAPVAEALFEELSNASGDLDLPSYAAIKAVDGLLEEYPFRFDFKLSPSSISALRKMEYLLADQKAEYKKFAYEVENALLAYKSVHADMLSLSNDEDAGIKALKATVPTMYISVFGGLDVRIGSKASEPRRFKRKKSQILLVLLAINRGREVTRETITEALWPGRASEVYRRNFYAIWSQLKKSLEVGGVCPYLLKSPTGCRLDYRFVACDLDDFDDLCRSLMFGRDDSMLWEEMYAKVSYDFSEDILCGVHNSDFIDDARMRIRTQLVDALISASGRMIELGEYRGALWFAREALRRDYTREDAYIALMESQIASNQRGAALGTYFTCRKYLSDELGIDPSKRVMELYRSIIESEEVF